MMLAVSGTDIHDYVKMPGNIDKTAMKTRELKTSETF